MYACDYWVPWDMQSLDAIGYAIPEDDMQRINKQLRALRKRAKTEKRRKDNGGITDWQKKLVVATYILSDYDEELSQRVGCLLREQARRQGRVSEPAVDPVPVRDWFRTIEPIDQFDALFLPVTRSDCYLHKEASRMITEVRAMQWVHDQNFDREVAPPSDEVAETFARHMADMGHSGETKRLLQSARSAIKNGRRTLQSWARHFRQRWGVSNTHLATLDAPARAEIGGKAGWESNWDPRTQWMVGIPYLSGFFCMLVWLAAFAIAAARVQFWHRFLDPEMGPPSWPPCCDHKQGARIWTQNWDPKNDPFFRPGN